MTVCGPPEPAFTTIDMGGLEVQVENHTTVAVHCLSDLQWDVIPGTDPEAEPELQFTVWSPRVSLPREGTWTFVLTLGGIGGTTSASAVVEAQYGLPDGLDVPGGDQFVKGGAGIGGWGSYSETNDSEHYGQVDALWRLDSDVVPSVKFGVRSAKHRRELIRIGMTLGEGASDESNIPDSAVGNVPDNWWGNLPVNPAPGFLPFKISNDFVASWVAQYAQSQPAQRRRPRTGARRFDDD